MKVKSRLLLLMTSKEIDGTEPLKDICNTLHHRLCFDAPEQIVEEALYDIHVDNQYEKYKIEKMYEDKYQRSGLSAQ